MSTDRRDSSSSIDHREQMILKEKARSLQENPKVTLSSSFGAMLENVRRRASSLSLWSDEMQKDLPKRWEKHGNMIVFPQDSFQHNNWRLIGRELWEIVAASLGVERLGRKRLIANDIDRTPHVDILFGGHGWVEHQDENGFSYVYDASKKVFEIWRGKEMARIAQIDAHGEVVVNLMSGLGYYTFPWVARAGARHVHAVDWDEEAVESLVRTTTANRLDDRVTVHPGEARKCAPVGVADRVYMALLPSSKAFWMSACKCLKEKGGWLHIQEAVDVKRKRIATDSTKTKSKSPTTTTTTKGSPQKGAAPSARSSTSSTAPKSEKIDVNGNTKIGEKKLQRKLSRSASIVEEMENRILPPITLDKEFEEGKWRKIEDHVKGFALDLAEQCCRYMNNVNVVDGVYWVTVKNIAVLKPRSNTRLSDIVVVDLFTGLTQDKPEKSSRRARRVSPGTLDEHSDESLPNLSEEEPPSVENGEAEVENQPRRRRRNWEAEILKQLEEEDRLAREQQQQQQKVDETKKK